MAAAVTVSALMFLAHESRDRAASKDRDVLGYVTGFMAEFTSIDPYHANDYVARVLAQATGDFAKQYQEKANEILLQVARAEPATGTVLDAGVERWNDDGTVIVIVAPKSLRSHRMKSKCWRTQIVGRQPSCRKGISGRSATCNR